MEKAMMLFEEAKVFENSIGPEATGILARIFERQDQKAREGLATSEDILALRGDMSNIRFELKDDIASVRIELKEDIASVRAELKEDIASVRTELKEDIASVRTELKEDIASVRTELKEDIATIKAATDHNTRDIGILRSDVRSILRWGAAAVIALLGVMARGFGWF
jgi:hypothetical protein